MSVLSSEADVKSFVIRICCLLHHGISDPAKLSCSVSSICFCYRTSD